MTQSPLQSDTTPVQGKVVVVRATDADGASGVETENSTRRTGSSGKRGEAVALGEGAEVRGTFRYRLNKQLGRGGFGSVYTAQCLERGEPGTVPPELVALKFFHMPQSGSQLSMLRREVSSLLALQHDRIIRLYDWCLDRSPCFIAVEYHASGSLLDTEYFLGKPIEEKELVRLVRDILSALVAAHRASILHLDIKPGNILRDKLGGFILTDFGISQGSLVSHHVVETGLGSPGYQAPEQRDCNRRWIGPRTDLWSVGATAWSLYTGLRLDLHQQLLQPPDTGRTSGLPPISNYRPCNTQLDDLIKTLVSTNPGDRPGGAAEALSAILALCGDSPSATSTGTKQLRIYTTGDPRVRPVIDRLVDPLWYSLCSAPRPILNYVHFETGQVLCTQGEAAHHTFVLLSGNVSVERDGQPIAREFREGTFLGENATLTGGCRTASIRAEGPVWTIVFNAAELEQFVMANPAVGIRLIKALAMRNRLTNEGFYGIEHQDEHR